MKKIFAILLVVGIWFAWGCCPKTLPDGTVTKNPLNCVTNLGKTVCDNKDAVVKMLDNVIVASNALIAILPPASPFVAQVQGAIIMAESALAKACPTIADAQVSQAKLTQATLAAQKAGLKIGR